MYAWSTSVDNPVDSEYIIMAEAAGRQAADSWDTMELESKVEIMEELVAIEKRLLSISFTWYAVGLIPVTFGILLTGV